MYAYMIIYGMHIPYIIHVFMLWCIHETFSLWWCIPI